MFQLDPILHENTQKKKQRSDRSHYERKPDRSERIWKKILSRKFAAWSRPWITSFKSTDDSDYIQKVNLQQCARPDLSDQLLLFAHTIRRELGSRRLATMKVKSRPHPRYLIIASVKCGAEFRSSARISRCLLHPFPAQSCHRDPGFSNEDWWKFDISSQIGPEDFDDSGVIGKCRSEKKTKGGTKLPVRSIRSRIQYYGIQFGANGESRNWYPRLPSTWRE